MESRINRIDGVEESFIFGKPVSEDKNNIKIFAKVIYNQELMKDMYNAQESADVYKIINQKVKEINQEMPRYNAIKGVIVSEEPLIKTTTNKIKRQDNFNQIINQL